MGLWLGDLLQSLDAGDRNGRGWNLGEVSHTGSWQLGDAVDDFHAGHDFAEYAVAGLFAVVGLFEIENWVVRQVDEELGSRSVRRVGITNHRDRASAVLQTVARFVVDRRARLFALQIGRVAAGDNHLAGLDVVENRFVVEAAFGVVAEEIFDGSGGFVRE